VHLAGPASYSEEPHSRSVFSAETRGECSSDDPGFLASRARVLIDVSSAEACQLADQAPFGIADRLDRQAWQPGEGHAGEALVRLDLIGASGAARRAIACGPAAAAPARGGPARRARGPRAGAAAASSGWYLAHDAPGGEATGSARERSRAPQWRLAATDQRPAPATVATSLPPDGEPEMQRAENMDGENDRSVKRSALIAWGLA
jgi:hypothetical protein